MADYTIEQRIITEDKSKGSKKNGKGSSRQREAVVKALNKEGIATEKIKNFNSKNLKTIKKESSALIEKSRLESAFAKKQVKKLALSNKLTKETFKKEKIEETIAGDVDKKSLKQYNQKIGLEKKLTRLGVGEEDIAKTKSMFDKKGYAAAKKTVDAKQIEASAWNNQLRLQQQGAKLGLDANKVQSRIGKKSAQMAERELATTIAQRDVFKTHMKDRTAAGMNMLSFLFVGQAIKKTFVGIAKNATSAYNTITAGNKDANKSLTVLGAQMTFLQFTLGQALSDSLLPYMDTIIMFVEQISDLISNNPEFAASVVVGGVLLGSFFSTFAQVSLLGVSIANLSTTAKIGLAMKKDKETQAIIAPGFFGKIKTAGVKAFTTIGSTIVGSVGGALTAVVAGILIVGAITNSLNDKIEEGVAGWGDAGDAINMTADAFAILWNFFRIGLKSMGAMWANVIGRNFRDAADAIEWTAGALRNLGLDIPEFDVFKDGANAMEKLRQETDKEADAISILEGFRAASSGDTSTIIGKQLIESPISTVAGSANALFNEEELKKITKSQAFIAKSAMQDVFDEAPILSPSIISDLDSVENPQLITAPQQLGVDMGLNLTTGFDEGKQEFITSVQDMANTVLEGELNPAIENTNTGFTNQSEIVKNLSKDYNDLASSANNAARAQERLNKAQKEKKSVFDKVSDWFSGDD